nr:hypothetical protein [Tanacetum cinerariifolium]
MLQKDFYSETNPSWEENRLEQEEEEQHCLPPDVYRLVNHHTIAKDIWDRVELLIEGSEHLLQDRESKLYDEFDTFTL